jgi:hypothetical protein
MDMDSAPDEAPPPNAAIIAGVIAAPLAAMVFWMVVDDLPPTRFFASPLPWFILFATFVAFPFYLLFHQWFGRSLLRFCGAAVLLALPPSLAAHGHFLPPRAWFATYLFVGASQVAALAFWACLRLGRRRRPS